MMATAAAMETAATAAEIATAAMGTAATPATTEVQSLVTDGDVTDGDGGGKD
jgi:hypothetical protein